MAKVLNAEQLKLLIINARQDAINQIEDRLKHSSFENVARAIAETVLKQDGTERQAELAVKAFYDGVLNLKGYKGLE